MSIDECVTRESPLSLCLCFHQSRSVVRWWNERETLYVDDFATENTYDTMVLDEITCTGLTGPDQVAVTSDSVISRETDFGTTHKGR